ncbi:hypothetical protein [Pectobacterium brasiliense]|uniref:hypothetical protein n=1 Tax=Pectobacterium brasiliense TaxID=180957 RepID=UPI0032ED59AD
MSSLTRAEKKWLEDVQAALDRCPSERIGFFTIGDRTVYLWDVDKADAVNDHRCDFYDAVKKSGLGSMAL